MGLEKLQGAARVPSKRCRYAPHNGGGKGGHIAALGYACLKEIEH